ncbi:hypothetical protein N665_1130s0015 [Sinapis alba]|nr:hypothetical protein N665_1130s0015 [Sinapis alba]
MSCNGCRVLRKGCSETCILRPCLQWIESAEAQGHATVFVAKFFGRAGLMSFISAVPEPNRPALFQSLLFEACGRTVNPVNGAVGMLWTGNWHVCQAAVETVLRGGTLRPILSDLLESPSLNSSDESTEIWRMQRPDLLSRKESLLNRKRTKTERSGSELNHGLALTSPVVVPVPFLLPPPFRAGSMQRLHSSLSEEGPAMHGNPDEKRLQNRRGRDGILHQSRAPSTRGGPRLVVLFFFFFF